MKTIWWKQVWRHQNFTAKGCSGLFPRHHKRWFNFFFSDQCSATKSHGIGCGGQQPRPEHVFARFLLANMACRSFAMALVALWDDVAGPRVGGLAGMVHVCSFGNREDRVEGGVYERSVQVPSQCCRCCTINLETQWIAKYIYIYNILMLYWKCFIMISKVQSKHDSNGRELLL